MKQSELASAVIKAVLDRCENFGDVFETQPEGARVMWYIASELQRLSNDQLFALYTEFETPSVSHQLMEEWDFSEYHDPIALTRFAIGLQILESIRTFFTEPGHSNEFKETISYVLQNLQDLSEHVRSSVENKVGRDDEQELLMDVIESLNDAHWSIDPENKQID